MHGPNVARRAQDAWLGLFGHGEGGDKGWMMLGL